MGNDRRDFFKTVGAVAAGAMISSPRAAEAAGALDKYAAAYRSAFSIDSGIDAGAIAGFSGWSVRNRGPHETDTVRRPGPRWQSGYDLAFSYPDVTQRRLAGRREHPGREDPEGSPSNCRGLKYREANL